MKKLQLVILMCFFTFLSSGQNLHYFRVNMGPKYEMHQLQNSNNMELMPHIDAGGGIYVGKRFNAHYSAEIGVLKNDYSTRFKLNTTNLQGNDVVAFNKFVYPTYSTYQLALLGSYRGNAGAHWTFYATGGVHLFLSKKLSREGTARFTDFINEEDQPQEELELIIYSNGFEGGNLVFRGDVGGFYNINPDLALDIGFTIRSSNLVVNAFEMEYTSPSGSVGEKNITVSNKAFGVGLYLGIKYRINPLN